MKKDTLQKENLVTPGECLVCRKGCTGKAIDPGNDLRSDPVNSYLDVLGLKPWEACQNCRDSIGKEMGKKKRQAAFSNICDDKSMTIMFKEKEGGV